MEKPQWTSARRYPPFADIIKESKSPETGTELVWVRQDKDHPHWDLLPGIGVQVGKRQIRYWLPKDHPAFGRMSRLISEASDGKKMIQVVLSQRFGAILDVGPLQAATT